MAEIGKQRMGDGKSDGRRRENLGEKSDLIESKNNLEI
jgi:hypothetical protein